MFVICNDQALVNEMRNTFSHTNKAGSTQTTARVSVCVSADFVFWRRDEHCWRHDEYFDVRTYFWYHDELYDIMINFLTSWRTFLGNDEFNDVMTNFLASWRNFLTSWHICDIMTNCLTLWKTFWRILDVIASRSFWRHDVCFGVMTYVFVVSA